MHYFRLHGWCCCAALSSLLAATAFSQTMVLENSAGPGNITIQRVSPVVRFRELLAMQPADEERALSSYSATQRKSLAEKLQEYRALPPEIQELRLRYTEVRWHLLDLMKLSPSERGPRLAEVSPEELAMVEQRLRIWDGWSAEVKKQFLENEGAMTLLLQGGDRSFTNKVRISPENQKDLQHWEALSEQERQQMCERFNQFFDLKDDEKKKALNALPQSDRVEMEGKLRALQNLSPEQRKQRLEALRKFSAMSPEAQKRFLQNAARWKDLTDQDRDAWRKAANKLPPMPPLPPGMEANFPPMPPGLPPLPPTPTRMIRGTNSNFSS